MYISCDALLHIQSKVEEYAKKPTDEMTKAVNNLQPTQWMSELNDCLSNNLSPVTQQLDDIVLLLADINDHDTFKLNELLIS